MKVKAKRIINVSVWTVIATVLCSYVGYEWWLNDVAIFGLVAEIGVFCAFCVGGAVLVDDCIREWHEWYGDDKDK